MVENPPVRAAFAEEMCDVIPIWMPCSTLGLLHKRSPKLTLPTTGMTRDDQAEDEALDFHPAQKSFDD